MDRFVVYFLNMTWLLFALVAALCYAIADIIGKYIADKKSDPILLGVLANFYAGITSLVFIFFEPIKITYAFPIFLGIAIAALMYAVGTITYYSSLKITPISEFSLLTRSSAFITFLGGIIFFQETLSTFQAIGVILIITAIISLTWNGKKISLHKGSILALVTALVFAIGALIDKSIYANFSKAVYIALGYFVTTAFLLPVVPQAWKKSETKPKLKTHLLLFTTSSLFAVAAFLVFSAYNAHGPISLTQLLTQFRIPIVVLYGFIILKERDRLPQKIISTILLIIGSYLLQMN